MDTLHLILSLQTLTNRPIEITELTISEQLFKERLFEEAPRESSEVWIQPHPPSSVTSRKCLHQRLDGERVGSAWVTRRVQDSEEVAIVHKNVA